MSDGHRGKALNTTLWATSPPGSRAGASRERMARVFQIHCILAYTSLMAETI